MTPADIVARVELRHPNDRHAQQRMLERWATLLQANDPDTAAALRQLAVFDDGTYRLRPKYAIGVRA